MQRAHQINTSNEEDMREREYAKKQYYPCNWNPVNKPTVDQMYKKFKLTVST